MAVSAPKKSSDQSMFFVLEGYKHAFFTVDQKIICMPFDFGLSEMELEIRELEEPIIQANRMAFNKLRILDRSGTLTTVAISQFQQLPPAISRGEVPRDKTQPALGLDYKVSDLQVHRGHRKMSEKLEVMGMNPGIL